jgi:hypothetical protein
LTAQRWDEEQERDEELRQFKRWWMSMEHRWDVAIRDAKWVRQWNWIMTEQRRDKEQKWDEELRQFNRKLMLMEERWDEERKLDEKEGWNRWLRFRNQEDCDEELKYQQKKLWEELQQRVREWLRTLTRTLVLELEQGLELAQGALVVVLEQAFRGELAPDWHSSDTLIECLPCNLAGTCANCLIEQLGQVVKDMVERDPFFNTTISKVIEFPASFSVSSKIDLTAPVEPITTYEDLESYMKGILERDVQIIPGVLGSKEDLKAEILDSMKQTWRLVRQSSRNLLD